MKSALIPHKPLAPLKSSKQAPEPPGVGFRHWMERVLEGAKNAAAGFEADPVHDLRVALRRCRSMADGLRAIDPDPAWRAMKRAGGRVFRSLGDLRDVQVMREWLQNLAPPGDLLAQALEQSLAGREEVLKREAQISLGRLDHDQWRTWAAHLAARAARLRLESPVFQYVALERWHEAHELHRRALRNRSQIAWHSLRVGIKRLRYTAENFLPERHARWGKDLKNIQDVLGEVHDIDVLWEEIRALGFADAAAVSRWRQRLLAERAQRLEAYRRKMVGPSALWQVWRGELPQGEEQHRALLARAQTMVGLSGASVLRARHVARLVLQLYDGLLQAGVLGPATTNGPAMTNAREILHLAALLQDVGRFHAKRGHHKRSYKMLGRMAAPLGWSAEEWETVASIARYHRGALPEARHMAYGKIPAVHRRIFLRLAAVLRLANALDVGPAKAVRAIQVLRTADTITLLADGYVENPATTPGIAIAKHLLETSCGLPILLRGSGTGKGNVVVMRAAKHAATRRPAIGKSRAALS